MRSRISVFKSRGCFKDRVVQGVDERVEAMLGAGVANPWHKSVLELLGEIFMEALEWESYVDVEELAEAVEPEAVELASVLAESQAASKACCRSR